MKGAILTMFLTFMMTSPYLSAGHGKYFYVVAYGAVGDGKHDDTQV